MSLSEISIKNKGLWDRIVKETINYDVFYLSEYAEAFQKHGDGEPILLLYENGGERAVNVVFKRDISFHPKFNEKLPQDTYYDISSPYGYGGFFGKVSDYVALNNEYEQYCRSNKIICEFVRFNLFDEYYKHYNGSVESRTNNIIRDLDDSMEAIKMNFEHKVRKNIKKAQANNLEIVIDEDGKYLDDFLRIYYKTMKRAEANERFCFPESFFKTINELGNNKCYFHVKYDTHIISTELVLIGSNRCYSFLGGTDSDFFSLRPNDFLKYEIINWAHNETLESFILGGGYGSDDGIYKYKKSFAPNGAQSFFIGKKIFNEEKYNYLIRIRENEDSFNKNSLFFPLYRS